MKLDSTPGDMSSWREMDFALNCTYIVPDQVSDPSFSLPKAMTSIPRNLTFEYGADNEVRALRFLQIVYPLGYRNGLLLKLLFKCNTNTKSNIINIHYVLATE